MSGIMDLPESQIFRYKADSKTTPHHPNPFNGKILYHKYDPQTGEGEIGNSEDILELISNAFYNSNIKEAYLPNKCTTLNTRSLCTQTLTKVIIPESVQYLGEFCFSNDDIEIHISNLEAWCNIENIYNEYGDLYLNDNKVVDLVIPGTVNEIKECVFYYCTSIESVTINEGVKKISSYNFVNCSNITTVKLSNSVEEIGRSVFAGCDKLPIYNNCIYADTILVSCLDNSTIDIKDGTRFIGHASFWINNKYPDFEEINIPNSVIGIGDYAFNYCDVNKFIIPDSVTYIGEGAIYYPKELEIGSGLKKSNSIIF